MDLVRLHLEEVSAGTNCNLVGEKLAIRVHGHAGLRHKEVLLLIAGEVLDFLNAQ